MVKETMLVESLDEFVCLSLEEGQQSDPSVIHNVLLCGPDSKNGRKYRPESFGGHANVKAMFENKPVYYNHLPEHPGDSAATRLAKAKNRGVDQLAGVVRDARWVDGKGVVGNIHVLDEGERLVKLVRLKASGIGMSQVAGGRLTENNLAMVTEVISVDVVVNPATTKTFVEQEKQGMDDSLANELSTVRGERDSYKAERDKLQVQFTEAQQKLEKLAGEVTALTEQNKQANEKLAVFEEGAAKAAKKALIEQEIVAAGLAGKLSPVVIEIVESLDEPKRKALLEEQVKVIKGAGSAGALPRVAPTVLSESVDQKWDPKAHNAKYFK